MRLDAVPVESFLHVRTLRGQHSSAWVDTDVCPTKVLQPRNVLAGRAIAGYVSDARADVTSSVSMYSVTSLIVPSSIRYTKQYSLLYGAPALVVV